jgi:CRP-like cAMP-binding protein
MQLVTPSVVAMVVSMAIANCTMVFQISFFFILHIKFRISELRNREALARELREAPEHPLELVRLPKQERSARRISQMSRRLISEHFAITCSFKKIRRIVSIARRAC